MDKLAKHGHHANKAALYGELCALLFAKSHYDEVKSWTPSPDLSDVRKNLPDVMNVLFAISGLPLVYRGHEGDQCRPAREGGGWCPETSL